MENYTLTYKRSTMREATGNHIISKNSLVTKAIQMNKNLDAKDLSSKDLSSDRNE